MGQTLLSRYTSQRYFSDVKHAPTLLNPQVATLPFTPQTHLAFREYIAKVT